MTAREPGNPQPSGPARLVLAADRRHYLYAEAAYVDHGLIVARVDGAWRVYAPAEIVAVKWVPPRPKAVAA
ncbi:MAG: hypothetical protein QOH72_5513 [Solirubrobacteraceae bacterium]|jgi:hypothetical protein|nr:hypothetical protein [Solirubrobacteraceae bacterium]